VETKKNPPKDLPPKVIKIGDMVATDYAKTGWHYVGFVVGDHLSPGGMKDFVAVRFIFYHHRKYSGQAMVMYTSDSPVVVKTAMIRTELLTLLEPQDQPILANDIERWIEQVREFTDAFLAPLHLEQLEPRLDILEGQEGSGK
jgi:hypothetical protein